MSSHSESRKGWKWKKQFSFPEIIRLQARKFFMVRKEGAKDPHRSLRRIYQQFQRNTSTIHWMLALAVMDSLNVVHCIQFPEYDPRKKPKKETLEKIEKISDHTELVQWIKNNKNRLVICCEIIRRMRGRSNEENDSSEADDNSDCGEERIEASHESMLLITSILVNADNKNKQTIKAKLTDRMIYRKSGNTISVKELCPVIDNIVTHGRLYFDSEELLNIVEIVLDVLPPKLAPSFGNTIAEIRWRIAVVLFECDGPYDQSTRNSGDDEIPDTVNSPECISLRNTGATDPFWTKEGDKDHPVAKALAQSRAQRYKHRLHYAQA